MAFIVYQKRQMLSVQHDEQNTKSRSKSRGRQNTSQNYDNLAVLRESHQYASMNSETNESHYENVPEREV